MLTFDLLPKEHFWLPKSFLIHGLVGPKDSSGSEESAVFLEFMDVWHHMVCFLTAVLSSVKNGF